MPTILTVEGLRVVIYPNDHPPSHVHVMGRGCEEVFNLQCPQGPPVLRENFGFSRAELARMAASLAAALAELCHRWRLMHGDF